MHVDGGCHCGKITYQAEIEPGAMGLCHCADCQVLSGSAFSISVRARKENFRLEGAPKIYVKTADSGTKRAHAFCSECGTRLYAASPDNPQVYTIRAGTIRQRAELVPALQIWCRSALPWVMHLDPVPKIDAQPPLR